MQHNTTYTFAGGISFTYATTAVAIVVVSFFYDDNFVQIIFVVVDGVHVCNGAKIYTKYVQYTPTQQIALKVINLLLVSFYVISDENTQQCLMQFWLSCFYADTSLKRRVRL